MTPFPENESRISNIYVDTQNLGDGSFPEKTEIIKGALDRWPSHLPRVTSIHAYINSSEEDLWRGSFRNFASSFPSLEIVLHPIQRYNNSPNPGTNAADIALVLDALSDLLAPVPIDFAAIISNDSGFVSLYFKLHKLVSQRKLRPVAQVDGIPFLLFTHDRSGPAHRRHDISGQVWEIFPIESTKTLVKTSFTLLPRILHPNLNLADSRRRQRYLRITRPFLCPLPHFNLPGEALGNNTATNSLPELLPLVLVGTVGK